MGAILVRDVMTEGGCGGSGGGYGGGYDAFRVVLFR